MEWVESTGSTIEEAKERALDRLGVHGDDAEFEIVADVKTGLFGRVKEEARVRARVAPATPRAKEDRGRGRSRGRGGRSGGKGGNNRNRGGQGRGKSGQQAEQGRARDGEKRKNGAGRNGESTEKKDERGGQKGGSQKPRSSDSKKNRSDDNRRKNDTMSDDESTMPLPEQADLAEAFVSGLAERFGTTVTFAREDIEDDEIRITVSGDDLGRMIGHRGTTAGAIDELVRTVLQRQAGSSRNGRIRVDVGGVRARRAAALAKFAQAQAAEVRESGKARSLEPMSPADRKVVHDALTDEEGVDTTSEGEDNQRRVVIIPAGAGA